MDSKEELAESTQEQGKDNNAVDDANPATGAGTVPETTQSEEDAVPPQASDQQVDKSGPAGADISGEANPEKEGEDASGPDEVPVSDTKDQSQEETEISGEPGKSQIASDTADDVAGHALENEEKDSESRGQSTEQESAESGQEVDDESTAGQKDKTDKKDSISVEEVDYSGFTPEALVNRLDLLLSERPAHEISNDVDRIKISFYKKIRRELEGKKRRFLDDGGDPVDFKPEPHPLEDRLKQLLQKYRDLKAKYSRELEEQKKKNLEEKYAVIEEIKNLVNRKESINKTFQEFRTLQERWRSIGIVPQQYVKDLWETYHHHVEKFYDYIRINKELRDLDLRKNMEKKIDLCEKAEQLILDPDIVQAFRQLQTYHDQWREIGPVPRDKKEELWERFKAATSTINKKHQEHFHKLKETQKKNLEEKTRLAEKAEEIAQRKISDFKEWNQSTKEILELQKLWKTIGFAPRKQNNAIYERFRSACDVFFNRKRDFYAANKEQQMNNLQLKTDLCIQAEALQESTEWGKTTDELIQLQKKWKEIGPVPRKYSDQIWKRFRAACDTFFQNKSKHYANRQKDYQENLKLKEELIREIESYSPGEHPEENLKVMNDFQRRWSDIGYVPLDKKDEIAEAYRKAINSLFNKLNVDEHEKNLLKYKTKLETLAGQSRAGIKLEKDREKFIKRIRQLESDITVWENNIGFFTQTDKASSVLKDVQAKIDNAKASIRLLTDKIRLIDEMNS